jgi:pentatricopeptide repeat protein
MNGMIPNTFVANSLMDMYVKCDNMEEAKSIFNSTVNNDIVSWNTLIGCYSKMDFQMTHSSCSVEFLAESSPVPSPWHV